MFLKYFNCFIKSDNSKEKLKRENTPYPRLSIIDLDEGTIAQKEIKSNFENVDYEFLPNSSVLQKF